MTRTLLAGLAAAAALASFAVPASACPAGYVAGWIQGNKVCHIRPGGNGQLKAATTPQPAAQATFVGQKKSLRAAQRAME